MDAHRLVELARDLPVCPRVVASTASTNEDLRAAGRAGAPHGSVLIARRQTAGKGRLGRTWIDPGEHLAMSVLLRPDVEPPRAPWLALAAAVAAAEALGPAVGIKWPNDLVAERQGELLKVGGVLCELELAGRAVDFVVVGVGVNLGRSPSLSGSTSLAALGVTCSPEPLAVAIARGLISLTDQLQQFGHQAIARGWRARSLTLGREVAVGSIRGVATALGEDGSLEVELSTGEIVPIRAGDVTMVGGTLPLEA